MERTAAIGQLPDAYQQLIALLDDGRSHDEIAGALGVEPSAVPHLVRLAEAKLARVQLERGRG